MGWIISASRLSQFVSGMLPGMTNVTKRARYYSFYPWGIHRYAQDGPTSRTERIGSNGCERSDFSYAAACLVHDQRSEHESGSAVGGGDRVSDC
jgi:hypothetical protein